MSMKCPNDSNRKSWGRTHGTSSSQPDNQEVTDSADVEMDGEWMVKFINSSCMIYVDIDSVGSSMFFDIIMNHHVIYIHWSQQMSLIWKQCSTMTVIYEHHLSESIVNRSHSHPTAIPQPGFTRSSPTKCNPR